LELGGKDPAYVRPDCDLKYTVETLVDGSFFNSGQCCCAIERIYVHADIYDAFVEAFVAETKVDFSSPRVCIQARRMFS
jgi:acyl-CoA reductase-like NAD-dependent aldehyde dehydrogenase